MLGVRSRILQCRNCERGMQRLWDWAVPDIIWPVFVYGLSRGAIQSRLPGSAPVQALHEGFVFCSHQFDQMQLLSVREVPVGSRRMVLQGVWR
jgi:hypothetical protein